MRMRIGMTINAEIDANKHRLTSLASMVNEAGKWFNTNPRKHFEVNTIATES